ncbi:E3 ubiquitin-protein ligase TRIM39-like [Littorina saxatilis]|uniref:E3 ubiquitin-protein ligase TRIM39-like n=1 Tax=Littorina saxatilis TaxID=31220 RepID=UPI0038B4D3E8
MAASRLTRSNSMDHECSVCRGEYREPKILQCLHIICKTCVLSWLRARGAGAGCPVCRTNIFPRSHRQQPFEQFVDSLPPYVAAEKKRRRGHEAQRSENSHLARRRLEDSELAKAIQMGEVNDMFKDMESKAEEMFDDLERCVRKRREEVRRMMKAERDASMTAPDRKVKDFALGFQKMTQIKAEIASLGKLT